MTPKQMNWLCSCKLNNESGLRPVSQDCVRKAASWQGSCWATKALADHALREELLQHFRAGQEQAFTAPSPMRC